MTSKSLKPIRQLAHSSEFPRTKHSSQSPRTLNSEQWFAVTVKSESCKILRTSTSPIVLTTVERRPQLHRVERPRSDSIGSFYSITSRAPIRFQWGGRRKPAAAFLIRLGGGGVTRHRAGKITAEREKREINRAESGDAITSKLDLSFRSSTHAVLPPFFPSPL